MISTLEGSTYSVLVTNRKLNEFAAAFPCNGLDLESEYLFQFDARNGDLVEVTALRDGERPDDISEQEDGEALRVLSEDAGLTGAEQLGLRDVIAIRYGEAALAF